MEAFAEDIAKAITTLPELSTTFVPAHTNHSLPSVLHLHFWYRCFQRDHIQQLRPPQRSASCVPTQIIVPWIILASTVSFSRVQY
jgi:hypothetical protein